MRISTKGRYGLRILLDLALYPQTGQPRLLRDIAESQGISEKYLSRLIIRLRKADLVHSVRGAHGGYRLARDPSQISLLDIIEVMEGPIGIVECVGSSSDPCERQESCAVRGIWESINSVIREALAQVSLQQIIERQKELNEDGQCWNYCF
ncbi:MAG: Rrf2 family transcriptional regulator [Planctomycetaceae bacterium]|nr:Rrf2 family transcriptional regulator [Planctomycetaceae bacterium]